MVSERNRDGTDVNPDLSAPRLDVVPRLVATTGPGAGRALALARATATVGRHVTNDLVLNDTKVSGVHLELRREGDRIHVRDAGSTNGTWIAGQRTNDILLRRGAEIVVGDTTLRVDTDDSALPVAMSQAESFGALVGRSKAMREIFATVERVAAKPIGILFQGESGTGKEELARAVVANSPRAGKPFAVVDVPSMPPGMLDAILFGQRATPGLLESANGGTVVIEEVSQLPGTLQAKFLRLLERQELTHADGHTAIKVDLRILATTRQDLRHDIELGRFREDLYLRLAQVRVSIPPLRDRVEDIPVLCEKLLATIGGGATVTIEADAMKRLESQPWPGNTRELRNALERAFAFAQDNVIRSTDLAGEGLGFRGSRDERDALDLSGTFKVAKERAVERFEAAYLATLMRKCNGNVSMASREADIARHYLRDLLKKRALYGIDWDTGGDD